MAEKMDYKKEYKDLYLPKQQPVLIQVPSMNFIMVDGQGEPRGECYQKAMQVLYALCFTIKMSKMGKVQLEGYFDYVVPPLEGLWWNGDASKPFDQSVPREKWKWTSMIRQPEFVTPEIFQWAVDECVQKKSEVEVSRARFETYEEGLCVQIMHVGPYSEELSDIQAMLSYAEESGYGVLADRTHKHHEIYLGDPRKTKPERLKTVLRSPVYQK